MAACCTAACTGSAASRMGPCHGIGDTLQDALLDDGWPAGGERCDWFNAARSQHTLLLLPSPRHAAGKLRTTANLSMSTMNAATGELQRCRHQRCSSPRLPAALRGFVLQRRLHGRRRCASHSRSRRFARVFGVAIAVAALHHGVHACAGGLTCSAVMSLQYLAHTAVEASRRLRAGARAALSGLDAGFKHGYRACRKYFGGGTRRRRSDIRFSTPRGKQPRPGQASNGSPSRVTRGEWFTHLGIPSSATPPAGCRSPHQAGARAARIGSFYVWPPPRQH